MRSAAELAKFAKGPLLKQFMLDKSNDPDARYERGYQPTEWGLREKERMRIACGMAGYPKSAEGEEAAMGVLNGFRDDEERMKAEG